MPSFLEFLMSFGKQEHPKDFHFTSLKEDSRISESQRFPKVPEIQRSGREIRLCYNLRSVERSLGQERFQWSIRQSAVYHSFDLESGQAVWINVKGNKVMKNRVLTPDSPIKSDPKSESQSFSASLRTHILFSDWSGENWRWYLNDLEAEFELVSAKTLIAPVDKPHVSLNKPTSSIVRKYMATTVSRQQNLTNPARTTWASNESAKTKFDKVFNWMRSSGGNDQALVPSTPSDGRSPYSSRSASIASAQSDDKETAMGPLSKKRLNRQPTDLDEIESQPGSLEVFTMEDLQRIQYVEERLQEVLLMLKYNGHVLRGLREHYDYVIKHREFPRQIKKDSEDDYVKFNKRVLEVEKDLTAHQTRVEMLLCQTGQRKRLVNNATASILGLLLLMPEADGGHPTISKYESHRNVCPRSSVLGRQHGRLDRKHARYCK
jgi:hypothetical protein